MIFTCPWWANADMGGRRCTLDGGHTGPHVDAVGTKWDQHLSGWREHGPSEAELLMMHRPEMETPIPEVVIGLALFKDAKAFGSMPTPLKASLQRLANHWLNRQLGIAWKFYMPKEASNEAQDN